MYLIVGYPHLITLVPPLSTVMYVIVGYPHLITLVPPLSTVDHFMYNSSYPCCPITVIYSVLSIQHSNFSINRMYTRVPRVRA